MWDGGVQEWWVCRSGGWAVEEIASYLHFAEALRVCCAVLCCAVLCCRGLELSLSARLYTTHETILCSYHSQNTMLFAPNNIPFEQFPFPRVYQRVKSTIQA